MAEEMRDCLIAAGISSFNYTGHSFRRGAAQYSFDNGMLDEHIHRLGRWSSDSSCLYFTTSAQTLYNLNINFQTWRPIALSQGITI